jgi:hypothetical protein
MRLFKPTTIDGAIAVFKQAEADLLDIHQGITDRRETIALQLQALSDKDVELYKEQRRASAYVEKIQAFLS